jgi:hypothetical protein
MNIVFPAAILVYLEEKLIQTFSSSNKLFSKENQPSPSAVLKLMPAFKLCMTFLEALKSLVGQKMSPMFLGNPQSAGETGKATVQNSVKEIALFASPTFLSNAKTQPQFLQQVLQVILKQFASETAAPVVVKQLLSVLKQDMQLLKTVLPNTPVEEMQKVLEKITQDLSRLPTVLKEAPQFAEQFAQKLAQTLKNEPQAFSLKPGLSEQSQMKNGQTVLNRQAPAQTSRAEQLEFLQVKNLERAAAALTSAPVINSTTQPPLQESNQLPLAFVVPYTAAIKSEARPEKAKRKKHEETLDEEDEEEEEESFSEEFSS